MGNYQEEMLFIIVIALGFFFFLIFNEFKACILSFVFFLFKDVRLQCLRGEMLKEVTLLV